MNNTLKDGLTNEFSLIIKESNFIDLLKEKNLAITEIKKIYSSILSIILKHKENPEDWDSNKIEIEIMSYIKEKFKNENQTA
tara:strand:- start:759 stop:1004 length:246 start_codon:yes stop_codon:yes gene_type:complete